MSTYAQNNVPVAAVTSFNLKFPKAKKVNWNTELSGNFDVNFIENEKRIAAIFSPKGQWLESKYIILPAKLPPAVGASFKREHTKANIRLTYKIETQKQFKYRIEFKEDSKNKEIIYDVDGTVIK